MVIMFIHSDVLSYINSYVLVKIPSFHVFVLCSIVIFSVLVCDTCTENEACQERGGIYGCVCLDGQRPNPEIFGK